MIHQNIHYPYSSKYRFIIIFNIIILQNIDSLKYSIFNIFQKIDSLKYSIFNILQKIDSLKYSIFSILQKIDSLKYSISSKILNRCWLAWPACHLSLGPAAAGHQRTPQPPYRPQPPILYFFLLLLNYALPFTPISQLEDVCNSNKITSLKVRSQAPGPTFHMLWVLRKLIYFQ